MGEGWQERSTFITREGRVDFRHFDYAAQALAKVERGHQRNAEDVRAMLARRLVSAQGLRHELDRIAGELHRFPAVHAPTLRRSLEALVGG